LFGATTVEVFEGGGYVPCLDISRFNCSI